MVRIWRLTAVTVGAALLGLLASAWLGAHLCRSISMEVPVATSEVVPVASLDRPAQPPSCESPPCAEDDSIRLRDEPRLGTQAEGTTADADPEATPLPSTARQRRGRAARLRPGRTAVGDALMQELGRGITKRGHHRYAIKRSALERALDNLRWLSRAARVAPEVREGKPSGFKLVWVKAGGPIAMLGLQSGDVLVTVNGLDITTPDRALDAYGKLKAARRLVLGLVRGNRQLTLEYVIR